jgi:hypothetical protein
MDEKDLKILILFNQYLHWIKSNNLKDTFDNYRLYVNTYKIKVSDVA